MDNIIIGFNDRSKGEVIKDIVSSNGFYNVDVCVSGDEVLRLASHSAGGIVICGYKIGSQLFSDLYEMLPDDFGMLVLLSRNQADLIDNEEIFSLVLPVSKVDMIKTVNMILSLNSSGGVGKNKEFLDRPPKAERSDTDKIVIERAKLYLMNKYKLTEEAAHRFLQKNSMNKGLKMVETARLVLHDQ